MIGRVTLALAAAVCIAGAGLARGAGARPHTDAALAGRPLVTPWPARVDCPRFDSLELSVDERVEVIEWGGPGGASRLLQVERPADPELETIDRYGSRFGCGFPAESCIVFRDDDLEPPLGVQVARISQKIAGDFPVGRLDRLVVRARAPARPALGAEADRRFGLRLTLRCSDPSASSLEWACDARSCVPSAFRDSPSSHAEGRSARAAVHGPYQHRWNRGERAADLVRLVCAHPSRGYDAVVAAARRHGEQRLLCERSVPLAQERATLTELARDLLRELALVLDYGCAGACSAPVGQLRARALELAGAPALPLVAARAKFDPGEASTPELEASLGWVARLGTGDRQVELACARQQGIDRDGEDPYESCRLTLLEGGARLVDFFPDYYQRIKLPDGSGLDTRGPKIRIIGRMLVGR